MHDQANMLRGFSQTIINLEEVRRAVEEYNSQILGNLPEEVND